MSSVLLLKRLAGESLVYGVSGMVSRFLGIFLAPIYTTVFAPAEYGVAGLVISIGALLNILLILSLDNSMARWYYDSDDTADRRITLNTFLWSCGFFGVVLGGAVLVGRDGIAQDLLDAPAAAPLLAVMAVNLPLSVFSVFTINTLRVQRRPWATAAFTLSTSVLTIALNALFILYLRLGLVGIFYAQLATSAFAALWTFAQFRGLLAPAGFDRERWIAMFRFSFPLIPGTAAYWVINISGTFFIQHLSTTRDVGLYQIATNVAAGAAFFSAAFQMAWGPFAYSIHKKPTAGRVYAQAFLAYTSLATLAGLVVMLFSPEILMVLTTPPYYDAAFTAGLLAFNPALTGIATIAAIGPGIVKNNKVFGAALLISALLFVALNFALVPRLGKDGVAVAVLLSQALIPLIVFAYGQKLYPIPYKFLRGGVIYATGLTVAIAGSKLVGAQEMSLVFSVSAKIALACLFCGVIFLLLRGELNRDPLAVPDPTAV